MAPKHSKEYLLAKLEACCKKEIYGATCRTAQDIYPLLKPYQFKDQEHFLVATLSPSNTVISLHEVTKGTLTLTPVHPREVFRVALEDNAAAIIVSHNHPAGCSEPSDNDKAITRKLREAGEIMGIPVLDHIIIGRNGYYSFVEATGLGV